MTSFTALTFLWGQCPLLTVCHAHICPSTSWGHLSPSSTHWLSSSVRRSKGQEAGWGKRTGERVRGSESSVLFWKARPLVVGSWELELPLVLQGIWRKSRKWMAAAVRGHSRGKGLPWAQEPNISSGTSLTVQDSPVSLPSLLPFPPRSSLQSRAGEKGTG